MPLVAIVMGSKSDADLMQPAVEVLNKFGIILIHDTDPISDFYKQPIACGDSYKIVDWIEQNHPELKFVTLPITEAGLTIVNRKYDRRAFL